MSVEAMSCFELQTQFRDLSYGSVPINTINLLNGYIQIFQLYIRTNSELQPPYGPAINHAYRVVTKSLHANLQNGSHFARGNSCVLRLDFILRWRPEVSFYKTYTT